MSLACPAMGHASTAAVLIAMCVASGIFIRGVQQHCRPGLARLGFTIPGIAGPVIAAHLLLCRWAHGAIITGAISLIVSFLMPMKALGMAMNRGPLGEGRADAPMPLLQYLFCYILPISAYHPSTDAGRVVHNRRRLSRAEITFSLVAHALLEAAVVAAVLSPIGAWLPVLVKHFLYAFALHCFVAIILDGPGVLAVHAVGLECDPHHNLPFLALSVAHFWTRWNLVVGDILRAVVYDPISEGVFAKDWDVPVPTRQIGRDVASGGGDSKMDVSVASLKQSEGGTGDGEEAGKRDVSVASLRQSGGGAGGGEEAGKRRKRVVGLLAAFFVSGLMHEWIFWVETGSLFDPPGQHTARFAWFWFFFLQAFVILFERGLLRAARTAGLPTDHPAWWIWSCGVLMTLGSALFISPTEKVGLAQAVLEEMNHVVKGVAKAFVGYASIFVGLWRA